MAERLVSVDALRGVAALGVLALHLWTDAFDLPGQPIWLRGLGFVMGLGYLGVPLFFVISGFCIHLQWLRHATQGNVIGFRDFWKRRLYRLYPPYFVVLCGSMALVLIAYFLGTQIALVTNYPEPRLAWMAGDFLAHATMLHGLIPAFDLMGGNPVFWSLAREEYLYLLYFPLLFAVHRWGLLRCLAGVFVVSILSQLVIVPVIVAHPQWEHVLYRSVPVLWIQWCLGMLAAEAYFGRLKLPWWLCTWWVFLGTVFIAYSVAWYCPPLFPALLGVIFFLAIHHGVRWEQIGRCYWRWPVNCLANVGLMSYSLYLVHRPVFGVVRQLLGPRSQTADPCQLLVNALLMAVSSYAVAKGFFVFFESRFIARKDDAVEGSNRHHTS